jgi:hypothetical protein
LSAHATRSIGLLVVVCAATAHANPKIVALAGSPTNAIVIGSAGETYEPDGKGAWIRHADGGIAGEVVAATRAGDVAIAGVTGEPPFERLATGWSVMNLGLHASALLGRGPRATAAVGKTIFALERGKATKLADAPAPVTALAASPTAIVVETDRGLARWQGAKWAPLAKAPHHVEMLLDARWAIVEHGVVELETGKLVAWPAGVHVVAATVAGDAVFAASAHDLVTVKDGVATREALPALASPIVGIAADRAGRVLIATRGGQLAQRVSGAWTTSELRDEPPAVHAGPPPAESLR